MARGAGVAEWSGVPKIFWRSWETVPQIRQIEASQQLSTLGLWELQNTERPQSFGTLDLTKIEASQHFGTVDAAKH